MTFLSFFFLIWLPAACILAPIAGRMIAGRAAHYPPVQAPMLRKLSERGNVVPFRRAGR